MSAVKEKRYEDPELELGLHEVTEPTEQEVPIIETDRFRAHEFLSVVDSSNPDWPLKSY